MTGLAWSVLCLLGVFLFAALGDLVSEEIRGWLDLVPRALLRLAAVQLDPDIREIIYEGEWLPDLIYELRGAESRPITRLIRGTTFALGLLSSARRIARDRVPLSAFVGAGPQHTWVGRHRGCYVFSYPEGDVEITTFLDGDGSPLINGALRPEFLERLEAKGFHGPPMQIKLAWMEGIEL
jgi:hypothetical protein